MSSEQLIPEKPPEAPELPRRGYNMLETSKILGTSYISVWRLTKRGLLRPSKALRTPIFSLEEIERFLRDTQEISGTESLRRSSDGESKPTSEGHRREQESQQTTQKGLTYA